MSRDHFQLVQSGLALHEAREYARALTLFEEALAEAPRCPSALYNQANSLHMLGKEQRAREILLKLVETSDEDLRAGCPDMEETPRSLRLDAYHLLFLSTLHATSSWKQAAPFLREHLRRRTRGLRSIWSRRQVVRDADELRQAFAPRAKPVRDWAP